MIHAANDRSNERLLRLPEVKARSGFSRSTIYRKMEDGTFPRSVPIGANSVAWRESDFNAWLAAPAEWRAAA